MPNFQLQDPINALRFSMQRRALAQRSGQAIGGPLGQGIQRGMAAAEREGTQDEERKYQEGLLEQRQRREDWVSERGMRAQYAAGHDDPNLAADIAGAPSREAFEEGAPGVLGGQQYGPSPDEKFRKARAEAAQYNIETTLPGQTAEREQRMDLATRGFAGAEEETKRKAKTAEEAFTFKKTQAANAESRAKAEQFADWMKDIIQGKRQGEADERSRAEARRKDIRHSWEKTDRATKLASAPIDRARQNLKDEMLILDRDSRQMRNAIQRREIGDEGVDRLRKILLAKVNLLAKAVSTMKMNQAGEKELWEAIQTAMADLTAAQGLAELEGAEVRLEQLKAEIQGREREEGGGEVGPEEFRNPVRSGVG